MYYASAKFDDDMSSGFCFRMLTYTHTHACMYRAGKGPASASTLANSVKICGYLLNSRAVELTR